MRKNARKKHSPEFKAKVALSAIREQETVAEIARRFQLNANMVQKWKREALDNMAVVFSPAGTGGECHESREKELLQKIGELTVERDFFSQRARQTPLAARRSMVEPRPEISMGRQAELLRVNRSGLYYESAPADEEELSVMRRLDQLHLVHPFYGSRKLALELRNEGVPINRKRVQRLMRLMGIVAMVPKPNTSKPAPENKTYPYLLRNLAILWPNQVWAADITYIPMARGFGYLVAIIDWFSRRVLAWRLSNSLDTRFCVDALEEALERFGQPDIFNTDQGSQFTADDFTRPLLDRGVKVSMDGKGRCIDNIFVERLWRSLKYEEIYLNSYDDLGQARTAIAKYMTFFNERRPHQSLGYQTPEAFYAGNMTRAA